MTDRVLERAGWSCRWIKRRAAATGLPPSTCCQTFRATRYHGVPFERGDARAHAADRGGHALPKTTKLYDRTADTVTVDEIECIVI